MDRIKHRAIAYTYITLYIYIAQCICLTVKMHQKTVKMSAEMTLPNNIKVHKQHINGKSTQSDHLLLH